MLTRELADTYPTTLVTGTPPPAEGELSDPAVSVRRVPLVRSLRPTDDIRAYRGIARIFATEQPDLVHTHMAKAGAIGRRAAARMRRRPRIVHTFHGHVLEGYFSAPMESVFSFIERRLARVSDVLIAVSSEVRDSLLALGIGSEDQYRVIPVGLNLDAFFEVVGRSGVIRSTVGIPDDAPVVGIVGRLTKIKDHGSLLEAMTRLPDVHLVVVGDGEDRKALELRARALGIGERTHFLGWWTDMASALADVDIVVLTSRNEGTPVALIEALAAARPVVATDVGGVRSVVDEGETGLLVAPGDVPGFANAIQRLVQEPRLGKKMGTLGRERVGARFGHRRLVADISSLYEELLQKPVRAGLDP